MELLPFHASKELTLGIELELQLINPTDYDLVSGAKDLLRPIRRLVKKGCCQWKFKPEITESMIEINSAVHTSANELFTELNESRDFLTKLCDKLNILVAGGGTHPFQKWSDRQIFPTPRYKRLSKQYGYLMKHYTVFGQHIHVGCMNGDDAIYIVHALSRYIPQLIALSASSPFYQGVDTGFDCSRINIVSAFPLSGFMPLVSSWEEFIAYFSQMAELKIVESIKDFYWDIRPKAEFGSVEVRICDTPLTIKKAVALAAYVQALVSFILKERPAVISSDVYLLYNYNRFQASRYGLHGSFINPYTKQRCNLAEDILMTIKVIARHIQSLGSEAFIAQIADDARNKRNDASWLRRKYKKFNSLKRVVDWQSRLWLEDR